MVAATRPPSSSSSSAAAAAAAAGGPPPMKPLGVGRHFSDLYPTVPKSPSPAVAEDTLLEVTAGAASIPNLNASTTRTQPPGPPLAAASGPPLFAGPPSSSSTATGANIQPPTPAVNRKLEFPSTQNPQTDDETSPRTEALARSKSAPPVRPPPPPPPKGTTTAAAAAPPPAAVPGMPKRTTASTRPDPIKASTIVTTSTTTKDDSKIPFSRTAHRAQARHQQQVGGPDHPPTSPHLVQTSKTFLGPGTGAPDTPEVMDTTTTTTTKKSQLPVALPIQQRLLVVVILILTFHLPYHRNVINLT